MPYDNQKVRKPHSKKEKTPQPRETDNGLNNSLPIFALALRRSRLIDIHRIIPLSVHPISNYIIRTTAAQPFPPAPFFLLLLYIFQRALPCFFVLFRGDGIGG